MPRSFPSQCGLLVLDIQPYRAVLKFARVDVTLFGSGSFGRAELLLKNRGGFTPEVVVLGHAVARVGEKIAVFFSHD